MLSMKRPSQCRVCRKMFRSKDGLSRHVETVHFAAKTSQEAAAKTALDPKNVTNGSVTKATTKATLRIANFENDSELILIDDDDDVASAKSSGPDLVAENSGTQPEREASNEKNDEGSSTFEEVGNSDANLLMTCGDNDINDETGGEELSSHQELGFSSEAQIATKDVTTSTNDVFNDNAIAKLADQPEFIGTEESSSSFETDDLIQESEKPSELPLNNLQGSEVEVVDVEVNAKECLNETENTFQALAKDSLDIGTLDESPKVNEARLCAESQSSPNPEFVFVDISTILGNKIELAEKATDDSAFFDKSGSASTATDSCSSSSEDPGLTNSSGTIAADLSADSESLELNDSLPDDDVDVIMVDDDDDGDDVTVVDVVKDVKPRTNKISFVRQDKFRQKMLDRNKSNECDVCFKRLKNPSTLHKHKRLHDRTLFRCEKCSKVLASKASLQTHMENLHVRKLPCYCRICGETFRAKMYLELHLQIDHPDERPVIFLD